MASTEVERTFLLADLAGYTALTEAHGNREAAKVVTRYLEIAREALDPAARLVERVGDQILVVSDDPGPAVTSALRLRDAIEAEPMFPAVRAGVHRGRVLEQDGQYFGAGLNLAARVAGHARAGQVLCTEPVAATAARMPGVECRPLGPVRFKNVAEPLAVFELLSGRARERSKDVDPVCRMQVDEATAPARLTWEGTAYTFCSLECARAFLARPEDYAR
jgi:class 3 adenylate cyclase/YHS domain-containing protein